MVLMDVLSKLVMNGSDGLVHAMYQRLRADRAPGSAPLPIGRPPTSWCEIADQAMAEGVLRPGDARLLRALVSWPGAPGRARPAPLGSSAARLEEGS